MSENRIKTKARRARPRQGCVRAWHDLTRAVEQCDNELCTEPCCATGDSAWCRRLVAQTTCTASVLHELALDPRWHHRRHRSVGSRVVPAGARAEARAGAKAAAAALGAESAQRVLPAGAGTGARPGVGAAAWTWTWNVYRPAATSGSVTNTPSASTTAPRRTHPGRACTPASGKTTAGCLAIQGAT